jgi:HAD superfamily hydrolase (TIGR01509 family)
MTVGRSESVQAVVFDLDGVLVDSETLWDTIRRNLAEDAGRPWPADATRAMQGMSTPEWSGYLAQSVGVPGRPEDLARTVISRMADRYRTALPLIHGATEAVNRLAEQWPLALASSSPKSLIATVLDASGLASSFAATVSTEEVAAGKPAPDVYLAAAARLGVAPKSAVAVEDSSNGLRAAAAAGLPVIAIPHAAFPPADDALALAAVTLSDLGQLTATTVRAAAAAAAAPTDE